MTSAFICLTMEIYQWRRFNGYMNEEDEEGAERLGRLQETLRSRGRAEHASHARRGYCEQSSISNLRIRETSGYDSSEGSGTGRIQCQIVPRQRVHLRIEESLRVQDSDKPKSNNVVDHSVVNMVEHNNSIRYNDKKDDNVVWWVDSGPIVHVCKDRCWFKTYESLNDGSILHMGNESTA
ncbi:hypothetical protein Tco_1344126 [Tanacetum coccineum]